MIQINLYSYHVSAFSGVERIWSRIQLTRPRKPSSPEGSVRQPATHPWPVELGAFTEVANKNTVISLLPYFAFILTSNNSIHTIHTN